MLESTRIALKGIIDNMWTLVTGWHLPGFDFTPAMLGFFVLLFPVIIWFISNLLSMTPPAIGYWSRESRRGSKND